MDFSCKMGMVEQYPEFGSDTLQLLNILRPHITGIAMAGVLTFGWILTDQYHWDLALLVGLDWTLINLINRITDIKEDLRNGIDGSGLIAENLHGFWKLWLVLLLGSFTLTYWIAPLLVIPRLIVQWIGVSYSLPLVPTFNGWRRFKDLYFFKNTMSAVLFLITLFLYPLLTSDFQTTYSGGMRGAIFLALFFFLFELSYEVIYDLRDIKGDREEGVPTYPVVHGEKGARKIVFGLLLASTLLLSTGAAFHVVGFRELLMLAAVLYQWWFINRKLPIDRHRCTQLTWTGAGLLVFFLIGTQVWIQMGLPNNIFIRELF